MDPLHGKTLEFIVTELVDSYGFEHLGFLIPVNCFLHEPSIKSSLKFCAKLHGPEKKLKSCI
jgi:uncharacterized protein (DUF2132 family)